MRAALRPSSEPGCGPIANVVLGIIGLAIAAAIAIPNIMGPTCRGGNETAAIATLRNLASCQARFVTYGGVDLDGDGFGEYGTLGEMTGATGVRSNAAGTLRGKPVAPPMLSPALAGVGEDGIVIKSGYCFRLFLPGRSGAVRERRPGEPFTGAVDTNRAEEEWCAYAWPVKYGNSGFRVFFVSQGGDVLQAGNEDGRYDGRAKGPAWDAAMVTDGWSREWSGVAVGVVHGKAMSRDGLVWKVTN